MYEFYTRCLLSIWKAFYLYRTSTSRISAIKSFSEMLAFALVFSFFCIFSFVSSSIESLFENFVTRKILWWSTLWINLIDDESSTIYKLKKEEKKRKKEWKMWRIFKTQNAEDSKCSKCVAWSALFITKQAVIISKFFHHFAKVSSFFESFIIFRCDARSRWRELSMTRTLDSVD